MAASIQDTSAEHDLVLIVQDLTRPSQERENAARKLTTRYGKLLCGHMVNKVANRDQFLQAVGALSVEAFCADALGKALATWKPGAKSSFSTWVYRIFTQKLVDASRALKNAPAGLADRDGEDLSGALEDNKSISPLDRLALQEALDLARKCIAELPEPARQVFVWNTFLGMSYSEIQTILPQKSIDSLKQIKCRATASFVTLWQKYGGDSAELLMQSLAGSVNEHADPARIKDEDARKAYRVWIRTGNLEAASAELKIKPKPLRKLLREAMRDLFEQPRLRGGALRLPFPKIGPFDLARIVELYDADGPQDALSQRISSIIRLVRAAFGFATIESATHTLGSFLQGLLAEPKDYDAACQEVGLKPIALRKLIADDLDLEKDLIDRLSRYFKVPAEQLRALPRRRAAGTRVRLRSHSSFDSNAFHSRVMAWVPK
jgi:DNA-directed RNA polymerase specialized sigma24 family protein/plasmid maintenance system antidote protein VapI